MVISIVYALPIIILSICLSIPIGVFSDSAEAVSSVFGVFLSCVSLLYAIVLSVVLPAAIAFYADERELSDAFRFGDVFSLVRDHVGTYLITFLMSWVASLVGGLGSLVCGVGWLITFPYSYMVIGHLYGQAYAEATGRAPALASVPEEPAPAEPEEEAA
jgi:hypothetical protein